MGRGAADAPGAHLGRGTQRRGRSGDAGGGEGPGGGARLGGSGPQAPRQPIPPQRPRPPRARQPISAPRAAPLPHHTPSPPPGPSRAAVCPSVRICLALSSLSAPLSVFLSFPGLGSLLGTCAHLLGLPASVSLPGPFCRDAWVSPGSLGVPGPWRSPPATGPSLSGGLHLSRCAVRVSARLCSRPPAFSESPFLSSVSASPRLARSPLSLCPIPLCLSAPHPPRRGPSLLPSCPPHPMNLNQLTVHVPTGQGFPRAGGRELGAFNPSLSAAGGEPWGSAGPRPGEGRHVRVSSEGRGSEGVWTPGGLYRGPGRAGGGQAAGEGGLTHPDSPSLPAFSIQTERLPPRRAQAALLRGGHREKLEKLKRERGGWSERGW